MAVLSLLQEGKVSRAALGTGHRGQGGSLCGTGSIAPGQGGERSSLSLRRCCCSSGCCSSVQRLLAFAPSSPSLGPARVVNVLIAALMSCKWDPTSRYIRVMSSHLTNGDLIELLIGCLFPPTVYDPAAGAVRGGRGEAVSAPARPPARAWPGGLSRDIVSPPFCKEK